MKKASILLIALFFGIALSGFSQATTASTHEFYLGKWEVTIFGTPDGDAKMISTFSLKDGKLVGEIINAAEPTSVPNPMTSLEITDGQLTIFFTAGGYDLSIPFEKVDEDNLKGKLMDMFDVKAKRVK